MLGLSEELGLLSSKVLTALLVASLELSTVMRSVKHRQPGNRVK